MSWRFPRRLMDRTPLRTKLITSVLALVIMALVAISITTTFMLRSYLTTEHDSSLRASFPPSLRGGATVGAAYPNSGGAILGLQQPGHQLSWATPGSDNPLNNNGYHLPLPKLPANGWADSSTPVLITVHSQSGSESWRVIGQSIQLPVSSNGVLQTQTVNVVLAVDLGSLDAAVHRLQLFDLVVGGAIVVVLAVIAVAVIQASLRPLNDIEMTAGQIAKGHLDHRIPERDPRTEIGSLGRSLNAMLAQIEHAFHAREQSEQAAHESEERMRRFVADASHELRTPLTTIRGFAEYYRQRKAPSSRTPRPNSPAPATADPVPAPKQGDSPSPSTGLEEVAGASPAAAGPMTGEELDRLMARLESEAARMGLLVEDLLQLARLDQQRPLDLAPVDVLTLAADAVQDARLVAPDRKIDLIIDKGAAFIIDGDEARLRQVLANLVNNALTHTPKGTPVRVRIASGSLDPDDGPRASNTSGSGPDGGAPNGSAPNGKGHRGGPAVLLDVEDDGPGMPPEQARRVFERFYRADAARNRASGGTGLGLAIVAGLVEAHGGTVSVRTAPGEGAAFQVKLPLSPDAQPADDDEDDTGEIPNSKQDQVV